LNDQLGSSVDISDDTIVVGAPGENGSTGSAYVFVRSGTTWSQQQKLTADVPATQETFGLSVTISGDTIAIGAPSDDTAAGVNTGSVHVFTRGGSVWTTQQILARNNAAPPDFFGFSVGLSGDTIVAGSLFGDGFAGAADVFVRSGTTWTQQQKLIPVDTLATGSFGSSVAISGDTVVMGAHNADTETSLDAGAVYLFTRSGLVWTQQQKLIASDGRPLDAFGASVSIDGDTVVVGAVAAEVGAGAAYVFDNVSTADLLVSLGADKTSVKQNDTLTYTVTVQNFGPSRAVNVMVNDTLPAGTVFRSAHANKGQFTAPPPNQNGVVTWYLGDMLNGDQDSAQLVVTVTIKGKTTLTNTATVHSETFDPNLANNTSVLATSVGAGGGGGKK
jgi:uncharacterized repeat protein (TIGR01451 family)